MDVRSSAAVNLPLRPHHNDNPKIPSCALTTRAHKVQHSNEGITRLKTADSHCAHTDQKIRLRLDQLKIKYAEQFRNIHALTTTYKSFSYMRTREVSSQDRYPFTARKYDFRNEFTKNRWRFLQNAKLGNADKKAFYMSNIITHQFEQAFNENGWLLELPQTVIQFRIVNKQTNDVLLAHRADYLSEDFKAAFLQTSIIGKSTARVAADLGMIIDKLTVVYHDFPVVRLPHSVSALLPCSAPFSVQFHVRPDPEVYDASG